MISIWVNTNQENWRIGVYDEHSNIDLEVPYDNEFWIFLQKEMSGRLHEILSANKGRLKKFFILQSGPWEKEISAIDIDEAKEIANDTIFYNKMNWKIRDQAYNIICCRFWRDGLEGLEQEKNHIQIGDLGYFSDWK